MGAVGGTVRKRRPGGLACLFKERQKQWPHRCRRCIIPFGGRCASLRTNSAGLFDFSLYSTLFYRPRRQMHPKARTFNSVSRRCEGRSEERRGGKEGVSTGRSGRRSAQ